MICRSAAVVLLVVGCAGAPTTTGGAGSGETSSTEVGGSPAGGVVRGFFLARGAPDPLACAVDADCTYGQTLDASGCCGSFRDMAASVQSLAYQRWAEAYRDAHCGGYACPSPPVPSEPPACLFAVRCDAGRCANACP